MTPAPRSTIGTPQPPTSRSKLNRVGVLLAHEVGVLKTSRYRSADPARVLDDARAAASYGIAAGKSWEYSYMLGLDGSVFTQAGEYRAAHCLNYNDDSAGVIFLNALDVDASAAQIVAWHDLRAHMVREGILSANHIVAPHYRYRSTSCPGLRAEAPGADWSKRSPTGEGRLGDLIPALVNPPAPPTPTPTPKDIDMLILDHKPNTPQWTALTFTGTQLAWVINGHADGVMRRAGVQRQTVTDDELDGIIASSETTTVCPSTWIGTPREGAWKAQRA